MKILKFGGTSVGSPRRMHDLVKLVINAEAKIIVLSAVAGTTNSLVEICNELYKNDSARAKQLIETLHTKYKQFVNELFIIT